MRFLLDSNTLSYALRGVGQVGDELRRHRPSELGVSAVTVAELEARGETIGMADTMIAAHALDLGLAVVSHNVAHFRRIEDLEVIDWY